MTTPTTISATEPASFKAWLGIVLLFLLFGFLVLVLIGATPRGNDYEAKRAVVRTEKYKTMMTEVRKDLDSYDWADKTKGVARIPIERAMQLELADLARKKPAPAGPIEPAPPAASPTPAASASPGASGPKSGLPATTPGQPGMRTTVLPTYVPTPAATSVPGKNP